ncbi:MAG TPA: hypothetical protein DEF07_10155 [Nitrosomonas sp.]|nr:hypothetical protein [Nitrosomonas sp.]
MSTPIKKIELNDGLVIRQLPVTKVAHIASLNWSLAGYCHDSGIKLWTTIFFEKQIKLKKIVASDYKFKSTDLFDAFDWKSKLNEEVCLMRCLLSEEIAVTTYALVRDGFPRDTWSGNLISLPWRPRNWFFKKHTNREVNNYKKLRMNFLSMHGKSGWENLLISMRRYAVAWENPFRADVLADIVAALEQLVVNDNTEVSYKLRIRIAHFLGKSDSDRKAIAKNIKDAYAYRSNVFHGGYVFDDPSQYAEAKRIKKEKGKQGNPFHHSNEVCRLISKMNDYYRDIIKILITRSECTINWEEKGLE